MADVARRLHEPRSIPEQLDAILQTACETIPGADAASITTIRCGAEPETVAGTETLVYELDELQYQLDEGPCLDALRSDPPQRTNNLAAEHVWPNYAPQAAQRGMGSQMAVLLYKEPQGVGGLNLYSRSQQAFDADTYQLAAVFAAHAALAMGRAQQAEQLNEALSTRKMIGQAIGIVMHRFELDEDRAFEFLVRTSRTSNTKLREVAQEVVDNLNKKARRTG